MKHFSHHGISYTRLKGWRLFHNDYVLDESYSIQTPIVGYDIETDYVRLKPDGLLTLKAGMRSDGPSGPTIDTFSFMRGAWVHDGLYLPLRLGLLPAYEKVSADVLLRRICICDGMSKIRAAIVYLGLFVFAGFAALPTEKI